MKKNISFIALSIALLCNCAFIRSKAENPYPYMADFLAKSKVLQQCTTNADKSWWDTDKATKETLKGCGYIEGVLKKADTSEADKPISGNGYWGNVMGLLRFTDNNSEMKEAVRKVLSEESDKTRYEEFNAISEAFSLIKEKRKEKIRERKS